MPRSFMPVLPERHPPTLWPTPQHDLTPMELAIQICEQENRILKNIVVSLSEIILNNVIGRR